MLGARYRPLTSADCSAQNASGARLNATGPVIIPYPSFLILMQASSVVRPQSAALRSVHAARRAEQVPVAHHRAHVSVPSPRPSLCPDRRLPIRARSREKYVTRAEYDDLKARFDHLEAAVSRILPAYPAAPQQPQQQHPSTVSPTMSVASTSAAGASDPMPPYRVPHAAYRLPSPQAQPARAEPPYPAQRSPHTAYRAPPSSYAAPRPTRGLPSPPGGARAPSPLSSSSRLPDTRAPPSRRASLSLAAITTPYVPYAPAPLQQQQHAAPLQQQHTTPLQPHAAPPKNRRAQTPPPLGQRLRTASAPTGPAAGPPRRRRRCRPARPCASARATPPRATAGPPRRPRPRRATRPSRSPRPCPRTPSARPRPRTAATPASRRFASRRRLPLALCVGGRVWRPG